MKDFLFWLIAIVYWVAGIIYLSKTIWDSLTSIRFGFKELGLRLVTGFLATFSILVGNSMVIKFLPSGFPQAYIWPDKTGMVGIYIALSVIALIHLRFLLPSKKD